MAPLTFVDGVTKPWALVVNAVGPRYVGSALVLARLDGWVIVLVGHCTRKLWAPAGSATSSNSAAAPRRHNSTLDMSPPAGTNDDRRVFKRPLRIQTPPTRKGSGPRFAAAD